MVISAVAAKQIGEDDSNTKDSKKINSSNRIRFFFIFFLISYFKFILYSVCFIKIFYVSYHTVINVKIQVFRGKKQNVILENKRWDRIGNVV